MAEREGRTGEDTGTEGNWEAGREAGNLAAVRVVRSGVEGLEGGAEEAGEEAGVSGVDGALGRGPRGGPL